MAQQSSQIPTQPLPAYEPIDFAARRVAYFSMEIALDKAMPTYSGGLGMLAGDALRSAADTGAPMVGVMLAHRKGYFRQHLDAAGQQTETDVVWHPEQRLPAATLADGTAQITITLQDRTLAIRAWRYDVVGATGHVVPVFLLDTDVDGNDAFDRTLTDKLYGGDTYYRLCQEAVLGLGGIHLLAAMGFYPEVCHMNEGHAALLSIGLLEQRLAPTSLLNATEDDATAIKERSVFTTHTPVPAGHDQFGLDQMRHILGHERAATIERFGALHNSLLNMTYLALRFSRYVNGVAMQHGKVSQEMFPDYAVHFVTNGVHAATWLGAPMQALLDRELPEWRHDNNYLRSAYKIEPKSIAAAHATQKQRLMDAIKARAGETWDANVLTLGFARRVATYKRATLLFQDPERLIALSQKLGGLQIVFSGKAHPADNAGKGLIRDVFADMQRVRSAKLRVLYLENYDWELGETMTGGCDVWLNTPLRPYEASGTSGMKAALNGTPSLSVLDGWWIEGCAEGVTGWAIDDFEDEAKEADALFTKLENAVVPAFADKTHWSRMQQHCLAINGSFFNTHRMVGQYVSNAYFPASASIAATDQPQTHEIESAHELETDQLPVAAGV